MNPEIIPILRKARSFNPFAHVFISSNGNRLSEEAIETVVTERLISDFQISIDGADAATFENIRPRAQYSHVLRSLERLLRAREKYGYTEMTIKVGSLVMRSTASQVYPYIKQMAALGVDRIVFVTPGGVQCDQLRLPDSETWAQVYEQLLRGHSEIAGSSTIIDGPFLHEIAEWHRSSGRKDRVPEWSIGACAAKSDQVSKRTTPCTIPWESLSLRADGSFGLCCNTNRPMGGPEDGSLLEPWMRGQHYQGVRTELVEQKYHRDCKVCLAGGLVAPDIITPPTYTSACLYPGDNDSNLAEIIGRDIRIEPLVTTGQTGVILELPDRPFDENEESSSADVGRWKLSGWLHHSETDRPVALLGIAINGIIREIVPGPSARTGGRWSTWIDGGGAPPDAEKVEIFGVAQDPSGPQLTRFRRFAPSGSDSSAARPVLNGRSDDAFPPPGSATGVFGWIEGAEISDGVVTLRGWACDLRLQRAVSRVILLVNGQVIRAVKPWLRRLDVARVHGPAHEISGFRIDFPLTRKKSTQPLQIVAIAVDAEGATSGELHWPENPSLLAVAMDAVRDNRVVAAVAIERARGWCLHTVVDENEPVVSRNRLRRLGFNRWLVPRRKTSELTGWVEAVERVDDMILVRGVALEASGRRPAFSVEFFAGQRRLGRTSPGIWQGVTPSGIAAYGAFTAVLPALGLGDNPRATLQVSAVSRAGRTYRLPWTEQGALTAPHEPVDAPAIH